MLAVSEQTDFSTLKWANVRGQLIKKLKCYSMKPRWRGSSDNLAPNDARKPTVPAGNGSIHNYIRKGSRVTVRDRSILAAKKKTVVATSWKDFKTDTCVSCPACSCEIRLPSALRLPGQFSVLCPNCGQRKNYGSAEVHDRKDAEATDTFRRIQFGGRKKISIEPKSWLNECASWLLQ